jgi:regulator of replication initiation timing
MLLSDKQQSILGIQKECDKIIQDEDAQICRLKNHNQSLVTQNNKLKNENKSQKERLEQFYSKETMTSEEQYLNLLKSRSFQLKKPRPQRRE